jgi:hypothetical protein
MAHWLRDPPGDPEAVAAAVAAERERVKFTVG